MDTHIKNDKSNPIWADEVQTCNRCQEVLIKEDEKMCLECVNELEEEEYMRSEIYKNSIKQ